MKKRENQRKPSDKLKQAQKQIDLTNKLMEMERIDREKVAAFGSGIAVTLLVPEGVQEKENEIKTLLDCKDGLFGCYAGGHKTRKSKKCKYHTFHSDSEVEEAVENFLRYKYPKYYLGAKLIFD